MHLTVIGIHQRSAPLWARERLAIGSAELPGALIALAEHAAEGFIVSTCNRVEICALREDAAPATELAMLLSRRARLPLDDLAPHLYVHEGAAAVRHIYRLAAGLDSMVLGEDQIVGQLKEALATAHAAGTIGATLHRLLHGALAAGKQVRTQTGIASGRLSVVSVALETARRELRLPGQARVLVVGAGRMAELALKHLADAPLGPATIVNRTAARAADLAARHGATCRPWDDLPAALAQSDVAVLCTSAPGVVIDADLAAQAAAGRTQPLLLLDLAVPRDVEPAARDVAGVRLYDVDELEPVCAANRAGRAAEVARAEALVDEAVARFMEWWAAQQAVPTIRALRERAELIREAEIRRTLARCPGLSEQERSAVVALSTAIVNKLLHEPIVALKDPAEADELLPAARRLFQISGS